MALNLANFKYGPTLGLFLFNFRLFKQLYKFGKKQTRKIFYLISYAGTQTHVLLSKSPLS